MSRASLNASEESEASGVGVAMLGHRFVDEFVTGLADGIPIVLMGALMGRYLATDRPAARSREPLSGGLVRVLVLLAVVFTVGRLGAQAVGLFDSGLASWPLETVAWTVAMGATIGVLVWLVRDAVTHLAPVARALALGVGAFGVGRGRELAGTRCGRAPFPPGRCPDGAATHARAPRDSELPSAASPRLPG